MNYLGVSFLPEEGVLGLMFPGEIELCKLVDCTKKLITMEAFNLLAPPHFIDELKELMLYYDYEHEIQVSDQKSITRIKNSGVVEYGDLESFLFGEIFYKKKKNLHYYPISNPSDVVCNFDIGPFDIVEGHPLLRYALGFPIFRNALIKIHNYGTFIRFSENKVQRLYWNPPVNGGIPLTAKDKDPVYELIFLMHDFGHFLLPDLIFTGKVSELSRKIYINWRLLGESITVVLNEMLLVDHLKNSDKFHELLKIGYDHPYKFYQELSKGFIAQAKTSEGSFLWSPRMDMSIVDMKKLFHASYMYFCSMNKVEFLELLNSSVGENKEKDASYEIWKQFDQRYFPVATRGREWTTSNYNNMSRMSSNYVEWLSGVEIFSDFLEFRTIDQMENLVISKIRNGEYSNVNIMEVLFDHVWETLLLPLLTESPDFKETLSPQRRQVKSFVRHFVGNLFLLIKFDIGITKIRTKLMELTRMINVEENMADLQKIYRDHVNQLYNEKKISLNEYHNYLDIFIMIPPNILKKDIY